MAAEQAAAAAGQAWTARQGSARRSRCNRILADSHRTRYPALRRRNRRPRPNSARPCRRRSTCTPRVARVAGAAAPADSVGWVEGQAAPERSAAVAAAKEQRRRTSARSAGRSECRLGRVPRTPGHLSLYYTDPTRCWSRRCRRRRHRSQPPSSRRQRRSRWVQTPRAASPSRRPLQPTPRCCSNATRLRWSARPLRLPSALSTVPARPARRQSGSARLASLCRSGSSIRA